MAELKTKPTGASVDAYLAAIEDDGRRADCEQLREIMERLSGASAQMWGDSIVGFGTHSFTYASGRKVDWMEIGFSSRKRDLTVYLLPGLDALAEQLGRLGKHRLGKGCLYLKRLSDVDMDVLEELVAVSLHQLRSREPV